MKKLFLSFVFVFMLFASISYGQNNNTGYNLIDSANVSNVSAYQSVINGIGNAHTFEQTGVSTQKNTIPYTGWQKNFGQYQLPDSVIVTGYGDVNSQLTRLGIQLRTNGDSVNYSGTSLQVLQAKAQVQRISFLLYKNSSQTTFNQLRFYASFEQNVVGVMKFNIVKIEIIYSGGNYTVIDDGSGITGGTLSPPGTLYYPSNGATNVPIDTVFRWSAVSGATGYSFNLDGNISALTDTFKVVTGMSYGQHSWSVATINSVGTGSYSSSAMFTTVGAIGVPSKPVLILPTNNSSGISVNPTFRWRVSTGATTYQLLVYTIADTLVNQILSDTTYTAGGLSINTQYSWRVIAKNIAGETFGDAWTFTTTISSSGNPPLPTTLIAPTNGATGVTNSVNFSWNSSSGATMYNILVVQVSTGDTVTNRIVTATAYQQTLGDMTQYSWKISAGNSYGFSAFSQTWSFTTAPPQSGLQAPVIAYPANGATNIELSFTVVVDSVTGATSYDLELLKDTVLATHSSTSTSFSISGLLYNTTYRLRVRAKNTQQTSDWGPLSSFTTKVAQVTVQKPTLVLPSNGASGLSQNIQFTWTVNGQADSVRLQLFEGGNIVINSKFPVSTTSYNSPELKYKTTYFWRMLAIKSGVSSDWTDLFSFTTMSAPVTLQAPLLISPPNNSVVYTLNPKLTWGDVQGAETYILQASNSSAFETFFQTSTNTTSFELPNSYTHDGFTYYWRVRAVKGNETSNWSKVWNFLILITTDIESVGGGVPTSYSISQNYPNPFNPSTVINFSLPKQSNVLVKIYDITGKEVETLVNEELPAGRYKVTFNNASKLASGIYIYRIISNDFVETKKMILMK